MEAHQLVTFASPSTTPTPTIPTHRHSGKDDPKKNMMEKAEKSLTAFIKMLNGKATINDDDDVEIRSKKDTNNNNNNNNDDSDDETDSENEMIDDDDDDDDEDESEKNDKSKRTKKIKTDFCFETTGNDIENKI